MPPRYRPAPLAFKIGTRIREFRREQNLTGVKLAEASGLSRGHVSNMEHGLVMMTIGTIGAVARALDVPPFLLLTFPDEDPLAAAIERVRLEQKGDLEQTARVLRRLLFDRAGRRLPPVHDEGGGSP